MWLLRYDSNNKNILILSYHDQNVRLVLSHLGHVASIEQRGK